MSDHHSGGGIQPPPQNQSLNVAAGQTVHRIGLPVQQVLTTSGTQNINVIATRGQQLVISPQGLVQGGMTRILNIGPSPRMSVVGTPQGTSRSGTIQLATSSTTDSMGRNPVSLVTVNASSHPTLVSSLSTPPRQSFGGVMEVKVQSPAPALVLTSSPQNILRTTGFSTPLSSTQSSVSSHNIQSRKRPRPVELQDVPPPNEKIAAVRRDTIEAKSAKLNTARVSYAELCAEMFFLQAGGTLVDYHTWRKRPANAQFLRFLRSNPLDPEDDDEDLTMALPSVHQEVKPVSVGGLPTTVSALHPPSHGHPSQQGGMPTVPDGSPTIGKLSSTLSTLTSSSHKSSKLPVVSPLSRLHTRQHSISAVYDTSIGSQEQIAEKAKQEAYVMQRIVELQREGLWAEKRLPKVQEPPRAKAHWDYLVEEMVWLAADFAQERKWKKAAAKKCARNIQKYFQEKAIQAKKEEKIQELRLKKIAAIAAKEVKTFWGNVEKVVEYKQQMVLEEKRKKALDQHLSFIVDQTEKYSTWLAESMNKSGVEDANVSLNASTTSSRISSPSRLDAAMDDEFQPNQSSSDDEETIAKEEEEANKDVTSGSNADEIELLKKESELTLEDLLKQLPDDYFNSRSAMDEEKSEKDVTPLAKTVSVAESSGGKAKNEKAEKEIADLQAESKMSIDELMAKYGGASAVEYADDENEMDSDDEKEETEEEEEVESVESEEESEEEEEDEEEEAEVEEEIGLKSLMDDGGMHSSNDNEAAGKEINDVAALAESIQPKGNTLSSTSVVTPIPLLLKHTLREYQHIGLDWLVTMFDRKLNGILADEMGLGKTIQTIALLAHLACEKGNWGPHLIIVPTSVMLNWEMELKKWCPAFKILTYYGTQKERKQKRTGWTKPNAFHICITSYKLVIQDHQSFRRKKWKYLILDEAQNIKNFKSQRWQLLLNFQTQRRLLLTGTPLQNNLMELWSLMHFLMPNVFQSHREFKEWFSNPVTGMIEGNSEYNESIIKRLHKVLRPFLLRRLKSEVEKQLPKKYEHVVMCRLSKRQRYLYDDFMSRAKTRETLATGNLLSVINVLMQLRKVCNHPNLFEVRPTISPFQMEGIMYTAPSSASFALEYNAFDHVNLFFLNFFLMDLERFMPQYIAHRVRKLQATSKLIEVIDCLPPPPPKCPPTSTSFTISRTVEPSATMLYKELLNNVAKVGTSPLVKTPIGPGLTYKVSGGIFQGRTIQLLPSPDGLRAIPVQSPLSQQSAPPGPTSQSGGATAPPTKFAQLVQTATGRHILLRSSPQVIPPLVTQSPGTTTVLTVGGQRLTVYSKASGVATTSTTSSNCLSSTSSPQALRPVLRGSSNALTTGTTSVTTTTTISPTRSSSAQSVPVVARNSSIHNSLSSNMVTRNEAKTAEKLRLKESIENDKNSIFYELYLDQLKAKTLKEHLAMVDNVNKIRCQAHPMYGVDLQSTLSLENHVVETSGSWKDGAGMSHCLNVAKPDNKPLIFWNQSDALKSAIHSVTDRVSELKEIFSRFVLYVPAVSTPRPCFHASHPPPSYLWEMQRTQAVLQQELSSHCALLHPISSAMATQFPDPRLIQYDCGKLQVLDQLLRKLKVDHHRVLIFTQMTRMLDVLEAFLNYHGYIYLRLDGTTRVDQRQMLMERFNADRRIFCFILSTRSGGIGVNLTGADTVIFYDSDWNPTMDAQAQDRCHRIGQTRDVHIYRLVSEMTVEENILKKANQKRLLGDLAIEGGNFTTAFFKSSTIQDLFNIDSSENKASRRMAEVLESSSERERRLSSMETTKELQEEKGAIGVLESALAAAEDEFDVQAARTAKAEAAADLAEFDETIPLEEVEGEPEISKAEQEINMMLDRLNPVERYAVKFIENTEAAWSAEQMAAAEAEIENQKREWELGRLEALREEEERQARLADDEEMLTFSREDSQNQVWVSDKTKEQMPMWCPPTPPQSNNDVYIDYSLGFLYEQTPMSESQLPPVYVKRERRRMRMDMMPSLEREGRRPGKVRHKEESFFAPRSLFDRPTPAVLKMRRDLKLQKYRGLIRPPLSIPGLKPPMPMKPYIEPENMPEWTINEDWAILQTIQDTLGLPLNLVVISPGHTPNWDLVADMVNSVSAIYRSPKQCRNRYEGHILPREEGKVIFDTSPKKQKKMKGVYKLQPQATKLTRPLRTSQLHIQNNNLTRTQALTQCYEVTKAVANKRTPTVKPLLVNPALNNPKHAVVIADSGIDYDSPTGPPEVAHRRAERIAKEKQKSAAAAAAAAAAAQVSATDVRLPQQQTVGVAKVASSSPSPATSSSLVVQAQAVTVSNSQAATPATSAPSPRPISRPLAQLTMQDMATVATSQVRAAPGTVGTPTMVTVANLPAQMQVAGQRLTTANLVSPAQSAVTVVTTKGITAGTVTASGKTIHPVQLQMIRQQHVVMRQQQQQQRLLREQQVKALQAGGQKVSVAVTTSNALGVATVQVAPTQRTQFVKQTTPGGKQLTRPMTDGELAAIMKRQQMQAAQKAAQQVPVSAGLNPVQILAQAGLQMQTSSGGTPQMAALVKTVSTSSGSTQSLTIPMSNVTLPQVKGTLGASMKAATPQQIRQIQQQLLQQQRKLPGQKITQLTQVGSKGAQLLVQSPKSMPATVTFQQLNQVMKQVGPQHIVTGGQALTQASASQVLSHAVLAKAAASGQTLTQSAGGQVISHAVLAKAAGQSIPTSQTLTQSAGGQVISHAVLAKAAASGQVITQAGGGPVISHAVLAKAASQAAASGQTLQARVIPVSTAQQPLKQTIQVVGGVRSGVPNVTIDAAGRPQVTSTSTLQSALAGNLKVNAALQGQQVSMALRQATHTPVRLQAGSPMIAVTLPHQVQSTPAPVTSVTTTVQQSTTQDSQLPPRTLSG